MINALGMKQSGDTKLGKSGCRRKNLGVFRDSAQNKRNSLLVSP